MTIHMTDKEAINLVVRNYVEGMVFANEALLRTAFHPSCRIIGHYHGELEWLSLDDFISAIIAEGPAAKDVKPFFEIHDVNITGDAAAVKVIDDYIGMRFTDYLSLLKINQRWMVVNKLYYYHK
ncbi:nuclear transport factor 2 family protein [Pseudomonas sp. sp1636]|uniref:nuclear transport factor 2 family protein n=1 Tax=Pseudomonas sp. sp1636 TaxID=3036707 RepID=UPI0025A6706D|nr:nuclear transport factor 2 family protein [Pseudomonas sp. sp1636]MDM8349365.1 nuclear transport factor 2 family protein [Pseudomonas sp. sp1636]